jgi:dienelactone hydrolase
MSKLQNAPSMQWVDQSGPIHSLLYTGEEYQGQATEVFAFYASPATLGEAHAAGKYPGIVLIHGGGGTAFAEWAWLWAKRGYAAIAMDLAGHRPIEPLYAADGIPVAHQANQPETRTRLALGGPDQGQAEKFQSIGGDFSDDWPYHAIAAVIRAHSLLRSFPEVDADRTAVTGISWGGYTTCMVASLDDRFRAAVPVYGCGFLHEGESVQKKSIDALDDRRPAWIAAYDPSSHLGRCRVPMLFVNGTNDIHYPLDSYQKSIDLVAGKQEVRIELNMRHSHHHGWEPQEIGLFIDAMCRDGLPLPQLGQLTFDEQAVRLPVTSAIPITAARLIYTTEQGLRSERTWISEPADVGEKVIVSRLPPDDANTWYLEVTDQRGAMVTTGLQFR